MNSPQVPMKLVNSVALRPSYKDPWVPDFDEMKQKTLVDAMRRVDNAVTLKPLDRQRVKDAVARNIWLGEIHPKVLDKIVGYAQGGSAKIARLAGAGEYGANVDHHSLASLMLELDGKFNNDKRYWQNRNAVKNALAGRLNAAGMSSDETYRLAMKALGRTNELARVDALQARERYNAAHQAELDSTNPNRVGDDSQAVNWSKDLNGLTPLDHAQAVIDAKAAHGANPLWKGTAGANFDLLPLLPAGLKALFTSGLLASEGFSHPNEVARKEAGTVTHSSGIDTLVKRLPGIRDIEQFSQATQGINDLWPTDVRAPASYNIDHWNTNSGGDQALKFAGDLYDLGSFAKDIYKGARGFLKIAEESNVRYAHEPGGPGKNLPSRVRPGTTVKQLEDANGALSDLGATHQRGGYWQYVRGLAIKRILNSGRGVQLNGMIVKTPHDLAAAAQMLRDPRFEVLRYIFVKDGRIVHHEAFSTRLPGTSGPFAPLENETLQDWLTKEIRDHQADGFYLLHNHPSGKARVSKEDINMTRNMPAYKYFRGHVIINSNQYGLITPKGDVYHEIPFQFHQGSDPLHVPSKPNELLGHVVVDPEDLLQIGKDLKTRHGFVSMVGIGNDDKIRTIAEVPEAKLLGSRETQAKGIGIARMVAHQSGSTRTFAVVPTERFQNLTTDELRQIRSAIETNVITDVIDSSGRSMADLMGIMKTGNEHLGPKVRTRKWH